MQPKAKPGRPYPLGATVDARGTNFAIFSEHAEKVELCFFNSAGDGKEAERIALPEHADMVWHGYLPGIRPGQIYGYRVYGPYDPAHGHRFNPHKLLLDPYTKAIGRSLRWCDEMCGYRVGDARKDLSFDDRDNAASAPLSVVIDPAFTWGDDRRPEIPWHDTIIYETHVRGFTRLNAEIPEELRGTYAGLASEPAIHYLRKLGVTAVELLPVHHHANERPLVDRGLTNYWGYSTLAFHAPEPGYAAAQSPRDTVREFKGMVAALHAAGIEVILDVVYGHTGEGNQLGPTLSFRGIDNVAYYRLGDDARQYVDYTGCGNTLNMMHPRVLQLIMDSLRYWVLEMHVDGFRFDQASVLARELHEVDRLGAFFDIIHQDPVLSQVKLIAEPWDLGEGGYQVGNFPVGWTEWNGKYRDAVRRFWKGDPGVTSELATRLSGSSDLYERNGRRPYASINFVTCHDGFTLHDLVSYQQKHNEANGENNRDGSDYNLSWNCGAEGPTDDDAVLDLREQQKRNFLATLLISQGVPMICGGDECGRTQRGNNNAYCQDNEVSWFDWSLDERQQGLLAFTRRLIALRRQHPGLRRRDFFHGRSIRGVDARDIVWLHPAGREIADREWHAGSLRTFGLCVSGEQLEMLDEDGEPVTDDSLLILLSAHDQAVNFQLPLLDLGHWRGVVDTAAVAATGRTWRGGASYPLARRSLAVLRGVRETSPRRRE